MKVYAWFHRYIMRDPLYAELLDGWHVNDGQEFYALIGEREEYRMRWHEFWQAQQLDFVLTVPNALPAMRHNDSDHGFKACGYSFLFNIVRTLSSNLQVL